MTEKEWGKQVCSKLQEVAKGFQQSDASADTGFCVREGFRLAYALEIKHYGLEPKNRPEITTMEFQTDLLVIEVAANGGWKPRVVIELKLGEPTTHDAITYSQKSSAHKSVHPFLRYGILIGSVSALSGRFFRHGEDFDFMASWKSEVPDKKELATFSSVLEHEVRSSQTMEKVLFDTRSHSRQRYSLFHRRLELG